jgi:hypothetical protein
MGYRRTDSHHHPDRNPDVMTFGRRTSACFAKCAGRNICDRDFILLVADVRELGERL